MRQVPAFDTALPAAAYGHCGRPLSHSGNGPLPLVHTASPSQCGTRVIVGIHSYRIAPRLTSRAAIVCAVANPLGRSTLPLARAGARIENVATSIARAYAQRS